jgi:tetratricopeptide (TPR) repeat protein
LSFGEREPKGIVNLGDREMKTSSGECNAADICLAYARELQNKRMFNEAIQEYRRGLVFDPENAGAWEGIAACNLELGNARLAIEALDNLTKIAPDSSTVWSDKGFLHLLMNQNTQGIGALREGLRLHPRQVREWELLATALMVEEEWEAAFDALERTLDLNPNSAITWYNLSICYMMFDDYSAAIEAAEHAISLDPSLSILADEWIDVVREEAIEEDFPDIPGIAAS